MTGTGSGRGRGDTVTQPQTMIPDAVQATMASRVLADVVIWATLLGVRSVHPGMHAHWPAWVTPVSRPPQCCVALGSPVAGVVAAAIVEGCVH